MEWRSSGSSSSMLADCEVPMDVEEEDDVISGNIPIRKIPPQNLVKRLLHREIHGRSIKSVKSPQNQTRDFYLSVFPNLTLVNVDTPPCFLRKFNPNGSHLLTFSADQTSIEIYKYLGPSAAGAALHRFDGDSVDFAEFNRNQDRVNIFELFFRRKFLVNLAPSNEQLNRECSLFTEDSRHVIVGSSMYVFGDDEDQTVYNFNSLLSNNEALSPNSSFRLENYSIYLVDIYSGRLCDTIKFKTDKIYLSHNQGIYLYNDTLAVLSVQHQTIHIIKIEDGKFHPVQKIGRFCFPGDEEQLLSVSPTVQMTSYVAPYREATINALKHRLLTYLYHRAEQMSLQTGSPYELRLFYQYFDHFRNLKLWKMQLLDEDHLLLKYAVANVVTMKTPEPNSHTSFFVIYNISEAIVLAVFENTAEEMLTLLESYSDYFRNTKLHNQFACSPSNNIYARHLMQRLKQTIVSARFGGPTEAIKRLLCQLPVSAQSFTSSPYLDFALFSYDEKRVSMMERPKCCGEHPISASIQTMSGPRGGSSLMLLLEYLEEMVDTWEFLGDLFGLGNSVLEHINAIFGISIFEESESQNYTCPTCNSGFIEEISPNQDDENEMDSSDEMVEPGGHDFMSMFVQDILGDTSNRGRNRSHRMTLRSHPPHVQALPIENILQDILVNITGMDFAQLGGVGAGAGEGGRRGVPVSFFLGNPGDYAWGREGLDAIVTQLLNQMDGTGPPPLAEDKINSLPSVQISQEQVDQSLQCSVCWDDFKVGESVRKLPCDHVYHDNCIIPWLGLHGTCPICRKVLNEDAPNEDQARNGPTPNPSVSLPQSIAALLRAASGGSSASSSSNSSSSSRGTSSTDGSNSSTQPRQRSPPSDGSHFWDMDMDCD